MTTVVALFTATAGAWAHAVLAESVPAADSTLPSPPTEVVMWFNEPLIEDASRAAVTAPDGEEFTDVEVDADAQEMRVALDAGASGVYVVDWLTVSPVDGHTWEGTFEFRVDEDGAGTAEQVPAAGPGGLRLLAGAGRATEYLGWLAVLGWLTLGALARRVELDWVPHGLLPWMALGAAGVVLTVLGELLQAGGGRLTTGAGVLLPTWAGWARLARIGVALLGVGVVVGATAGQNPAVPNRRIRVLVTLLTLAALILLAASGHAASTSFSLLVGAGHLATAGVWAGTIVVMAVDRPPGGWRGERGRRLISEFAPIGLTMFAATVLLGALRAVQELSRLSDLWTSAYGQVLAVKVLLVLAMAPLSWLAWRRAAPLLRVEGALATGAVVLAAGLAILGPPAPGADDRPAPGAAPQTELDGAVEAEPVEEGLPQRDDLTLAGDAGTTVVGLTIRPGQPGDNELFAYLVPIDGTDEAGALEATVTVAGAETVAMEACGEACRTTTVPLQRGEPIEIAVHDADQQRSATFELPELPAPDGADLLHRAEQRMNQLRTLRYDEVFGPHEPPTTSTWEIVAPDQLYGVITRGDDHHETLRIADRRWRRGGPEEAWEGGEPGGPRVTANRFIWEEEGRTAVRIVGTEEVAGVPTREVSFFFEQRGQLPIWYRVWVDEEDLIRQAQMRTRGHFMDHRYYDFDADIQIEAPG